MGASPWMATVVAVVKVRVLIRLGQVGSVALCGVLQFAQRIGGWVYAGPFLHAVRLQGCSLVS